MNEKIVWRRSNGVNGKAPQAVVAVLQICGKKPQKRSENKPVELGGDRGPARTKTALLADSQRGSERKEKADTYVVKEEECASVNTAGDSYDERNARVRFRRQYADDAESWRIRVKVFAWIGNRISGDFVFR
jgi:hypothetical protein